MFRLIQAWQPVPRGIGRARGRSSLQRGVLFFFLVGNPATGCPPGVLYCGPTPAILCLTGGKIGACAGEPALRSFPCVALLNLPFVTNFGHRKRIHSRAGCFGGARQERQLCTCQTHHRICGVPLCVPCIFRHTPRYTLLFVCAAVVALLLWILLGWWIACLAPACPSFLLFSCLVVLTGALWQLVAAPCGL